MAKGIDKELKKIQKRGIYNPKVRVFSIIAIAVLTLGIGLTFSAFSYSSGDSQAFNSTVTKKVNITVKTTNGYPSTLAGKILTDNEVKENPNFSNSHTDKGLYVQKGDNTKSVDGKPTYYYRGEVTNNYLSFAGMTWRIVRINEDGTIRLISANEYHNDDIGNLYSTTNANYSTSQVKEAVDAWYNELSADNKKNIATGKFCNDTTNTASSRLSSNPTFVCPSGANYLSLNAGIITADELRYAGSAHGSYSPTYISNGWNWTMTQASATSMYIALTSGVWNHDSTINVNTRYHRYVINLKAETIYKSGDGTSSSPYVVEGLASTVNTYIKESRYNKATDINVYPYEGYTYESVSCDNGQTATYDSNAKKITISAKKDTTCTVNFKEPQKLASAVLANNTLRTSTPDFAYGVPNDTLTSNESGLFKSTDDLGESYYFRGDVISNYVKFANFYWRIVRVNGDKSIRLIYDGTEAYDNSNSINKSIGQSAFNDSTTDPKYVGYTYDNIYDSNGYVTNGTDSVIKIYIDNWYEKNLKSNDDSIELGIFCNDTTSSTDKFGNTVYGAYNRNMKSSGNVPVLTCPTIDKTYGGKYKLKVGLLSADEMAIAGIGYNSGNYHTPSGNYLGTSSEFWSMSPYNYSSSYGGYMFTTSIHYLNGEYKNSLYERNIDISMIQVRPVINLKADVTVISGNGTKSNPYVVE